MVKYNVDSLVDYMLVSEEFNEPETRLPFTDDDLRRLDDAATLANLSPRRASVLQARHDPARASRARDLAFRRDALLGLDRCIGELVHEMLQVRHLRLGCTAGAFRGHAG